MIGGVVIEKIVLSDRVWVMCVERHELCHDKRALYVERNAQSERINPGDSLWWQGKVAMWTPYSIRTNHGLKNAMQFRCGVDYDIEIPRIGYSGVSRPKS